jgi:Porin PorA
MRRVIGLTLAGLGAFLFAAALLLRGYVAGQLVKFPINEYVKTTLLARDVSYFSPSLVREVTGATIRVTDTIKGDGSAGTPSTAVWNEFTYLYDTTNHATYAYSTRRAAFDRRTSQLVDCCGANIGGNSAIRQTGLSGYVWPIGSQKKTYMVFDSTLNRPMPYRYAGTGTTRRPSRSRYRPS